MIDKIETEQLLKAEETLKKPLNSIKKVLTSLNNFSTDKKLRKVIDLTIPYELRLQIEKNRRNYRAGKIKAHNYGVIECSNMIYVVEKNILHLHNLFTGFQININCKENIVYVLSLKPDKNVFKENVSVVLLIVTNHHLNFYVYRKDEDEFLDVQIEYKFSQPVNNIKVTEFGRIFAIHQHEMIEISYGMHNCSFYSFNSTVLDYVFPFFSRRQKEEVLEFDVMNNFLVTLKKKEIDVYYIKKSIKKVNTIKINKLYKTIGIIEEENKITILNGNKVNGNVFFCAISSDGKRDFFDIHQLIYAKKSPLEVKHTDIIAVKGENYTIQSVDKCVLVRINENQLYNFDSNKSSENYEIVHGHHLQIGDRIFSFTDRVSVYEYLKGDDLLLCSNNPTYIIQNYGSICTLFYLLLNANGKNTYLIDYLFENMDRNFIFLIVAHLLKDIINTPIQNMEYIILDNMINKFRNIEKFDIFIRKVTGALYFAKLAYENRVTFINDITINDLLHNRKIDRWKKCLKVLNLHILKVKCYDFLCLDDIFYHNAKKMIAIGTRESYSKAVQDLLNVEVNKEIVDLLIQGKYYIGAIKLIKKMNLRYEPLVEILKESIKCKEALNLALESQDENFCYAVFDAYLRNDMRFDECVCCDEKYDNYHICNIQHEFIESFLKDKFFKSQYKEEYDLFWKFLIQNKKIKEGIDALNTVIRIKNTDISEKIRYLNIIYTFDSSAKFTLNIAKIQKEIAERMNKSLDNLIEADVLFNDYAYKYCFYDLALKILDLCDCEREILFDVMCKYLSGPVEAIESKLLRLELSGRCLDLNVLLSILSIKKINIKINICEIFEKLQFTRERIIESIKQELTHNIAPETKKYLLECVETKYGLHGDLMI